MKIREIDNPEYFQRLVVALLTAEYGLDFQAVDDSGGDSGLDGYLRSSGTLIAVYCPEKKPEAKRLRSKIRSDLGKAIRLKAEARYSVARWVFVTPQTLREPEQRLVRDLAEDQGLSGICMGEEHLTELFLRHEHLHQRFPEIAMPQTQAMLRQILEGVNSIQSSLDASPGVARGQGTSRLVQPPYSGRLLDLQEGFLRGDPDTPRHLEILRLESRDRRERLWAGVLLLYGFDRTVTDFTVVERLARDVLAEAESMKDSRATIIAKAELAWILYQRFARIDMETCFRSQFSAVSGFGPLSRDERSRVAAQLNDLSSEAEALFDSAFQLAESTRHYRDLVLVLQRKANARTIRLLFHQTIPELHEHVQAETGSLRREYEGCIQLWVQLDNPRGVAEVYHNYANDEFTLGYVDRALMLAQRSLDVATEHNLSGQATQTRELLKVIRGTPRREPRK